MEEIGLMTLTQDGQYHDICERWELWWPHQMETFSALLAICAGNSPVPGEFLAQRPVTRNFDVFFDLRSNKRLSKHWWGWWFEKPSCPLWRIFRMYLLLWPGFISALSCGCSLLPESPGAPYCSWHESKKYISMDKFIVKNIPGRVLIMHCYMEIFSV